MTDDILMLASNIRCHHVLFQHLQTDFDLTFQTGAIIKFLNLRIIQSNHGISIDQNDHIDDFLRKYFANRDPSSIPYFSYPFPTSNSFERRLYESLPLLGVDRHTFEQKFGGTFATWVGALNHLAVTTRLDLSHAVMRFSTYMSCPNAVIYETLDMCLCFLY